MHLKLDPWTASSLLQKAIRRGETEFAQYAASILHRYRGAAIWPRLITIAVEDIGIADLELVAEVTRLGTDKALRAVLGSDAELVDDVTDKLAAAPKDRSADYLNSAIMWELAAAQDLFQTGTGQLLGEPEAVRPLLAEATKLLLKCTTIDRTGRTINRSALWRLLGEDRDARGTALEDTLPRLADNHIDPFALMLLPLWSAFSAAGTTPTVSTQPLPSTRRVKGVPLYVWDKHTALGKRAISLFAVENPQMHQMLSRWIARRRWSDVASIAAFYVDAMPVSRMLQWDQGETLYELGLRADMLMAGCPAEAVQDLVTCARDNLEHLNSVRERLFVPSQANKV